ncbi:TAP-like protein-domain-containing protein [Lophiotrema nucula]|uniref:TAP-like protein-domain-containing protein n=1 Tax=Lophiotrema nucula TaxID=690887 RepID=A0A6A5ZDJ6_9PLEO|nr:TAP-like protein-domain-containing protein [Lophiotrema nucula]
MSRMVSLLAILLSSIAAASPIPSQTIEWGPCPTEGPEAENYASATIPIECGNFAVPIDYTNPDSAPLNLSLVRVPALSGGVYDFVAFDPRSVAADFRLVCATNNFTIAQVLTTASDLSVSEHDSRRGWAVSKANTGICQYQGNGNETAEYIGTVAMARDMASVAEAVDKDGLIRYWGFSYGTTLGATIASMFPDKVDRMLIDGIQNAKQYYHEWTDSELWTYTDKAVEYLFESCAAAGPEYCALAAATNRTGGEMARDFYNFVEDITAAPIGLPKSGSALDGVTLKATIFSQTYDAAGWANFSKVLAPILYGTEEQRIAALESFGKGAAESISLGPSEPNWGIHCGDRIPRTDDFEEIYPSLLNLYNTSYYQGGPNAAVQAVCAQWPWKAKEVYEGNFEAKTKHPILVMSNSLDGQTPIVSARNMSAGFEGAVILENDGVGHCAFSYPTTCAAKHVIAYWVNGTMPAEGTLCEAEFDPYQKLEWADVLQLMANGTTPGNATLSAKKWLAEQLGS